MSKHNKKQALETLRNIKEKGQRGSQHLKKKRVLIRVGPFFCPLFLFQENIFFALSRCFSSILEFIELFESQNTAFFSPFSVLYGS